MLSDSEDGVRRACWKILREGEVFLDRFQGSGREVLLGHFEGVGLRSWRNRVTSCIARGQGIRGVSKLFSERFVVFFSNRNRA